MRTNWRWDKVKTRCTRSTAATDPARLPDPAVRRPAGEPRQRDGPSIARHGRFVRQPGAGADASCSTRRWADQPPNQRAPITIEVLPKKLDEEVAHLNGRRFRRRRDSTDQDAGRIHRRERRRPVQTRRVQVLIEHVATDALLDRSCCSSPAKAASARAPWQRRSRPQSARAGRRTLLVVQQQSDVRASATRRCGALSTGRRSNRTSICAASTAARH